MGSIVRSPPINVLGEVCDDRPIADEQAVDELETENNSHAIRQLTLDVHVADQLTNSFNQPGQIRVSGSSAPQDAHPDAHNVLGEQP